MKTAKLIKRLEGFTGDARLYELSEPVEYDKLWGESDAPAKTTRFVIVSATHAMFSGPETYIFPADENGNVINWGELDGSGKGSLSHESVLEDAGYALA